MITLKKIILTIVVVFLIVTVVNTLLYLWLKTSSLMEIVEKDVHDDQHLMSTIGKVKSITPLFLSSKRFSWTGRRIVVRFNVFVSGTVRNCTVNFIMEKTDNVWRVKNREIKKCYDSGC
jgi:hypothetical protein